MTPRHPKGGKRTESMIHKLLDIGLLSNKSKLEVIHNVFENCCISIDSQNNNSDTTIDCNQVYITKMTSVLNL